MNQVPIDLLKPHPKNKEFFPDALPENLWRELIEDIRKNGIINPLIVATDYTVLAGHLRLEAAKEAGLTHVPVVIRDVDPNSDEAIGLLIKDNLLRRQLNEMQVAKLIRVLKEQFGVKPGKPVSGKNGTGKHDKMSELTALTGMNERQIQRLDKLNDLIPELQALVSSSKLGSTAAYELAFLSPETQRQLLAAYGEKIASLKQSEAKELRARIEAEVKAEAEKQVNELKKNIETLNRQKSELQMFFEERERELKRAIADLQNLLKESVPSAKVAELEQEFRTKEKELASVRWEFTSQEQEYKKHIAELKRQLAELKSKPVEKVVLDPALLAELEAARAEAASLLKEKNFIQERMREIALESERKEAKLRELKVRVEELERREEVLKKSLARKENKPKPDSAQEET
ncbi:MAG: ParB N-terminal domain-containing protein, partial [Firmicutes bacterium]|nr:ParB N-terminal domain-containing protein [Bacillota bacterium]